MGMVKFNRFEIYLIELDPTLGSEIRKTRPCVVVSANEMNVHLKTVIVAPMTTKGLDIPTRINIEFQGKSGQIALDQIRTVDKSRLVKKLGSFSDKLTKEKICNTLLEMFVL